MIVPRPISEFRCSERLACKQLSRGVLPETRALYFRSCSLSHRMRATPSLSYGALLVSKSFVFEFFTYRIEDDPGRKDSGETNGGVRCMRSHTALPIICIKSRSEYSRQPPFIHIFTPLMTTVCAA